MPSWIHRNCLRSNIDLCPNNPGTSHISTDHSSSSNISTSHFCPNNSSTSHISTSHSSSSHIPTGHPTSMSNARSSCHNCNYLPHHSDHPTSLSNTRSNIPVRFTSVLERWLLSRNKHLPIFSLRVSYQKISFIRFHFIKSI